MPRLRSVSRREFISRLKELGFGDPEGGPDHALMRHPDGRLVKVPNPHREDIGVDLLRRILKNHGISRTDWFGE
jgi:predicted RNA binding protein YcfA (HicA-like mRNA interferase family)